MSWVIFPSKSWFWKKNRRIETNFSQISDKNLRPFLKPTKCYWVKAGWSTVKLVQINAKGCQKMKCIQWYWYVLQLFIEYFKWQISHIQIYLSHEGYIGFSQFVRFPDKWKLIEIQISFNSAAYLVKWWRKKLDGYLIFLNLGLHLKKTLVCIKNITITMFKHCLLVLTLSDLG